METRDLFNKSASIIRYTFVVAFVLLVLHLFWTQYGSLDGWLLPNGRLVGADFFAFYFAGSQIGQVPIEEIYNFENQVALQQKMLEAKGVVGEGRLPFIYPPLVALFFSLFSYSDYVTSYFTWVGFCILLFLLSFYLLVKALDIPQKRAWLYLLFCLAFPPFVLECLAGGQTSVLGFAICCGLVFFLKQQQFFLAGLVLSLSYYKPPLFLVFLLISVFRYRKEFFLGFLTGAVALMASTLFITGFDGFIYFLQQASSYRLGSDIVADGRLPLSKGVGLLAFCISLVGSKSIAWLVYIAASVGLVFVVLRSKSSSKLAPILVLSLILSVQMAAYDLTLVLLPLIILWEQSARAGNRSVLCVFATIGLFSEFLFRSAFGVQWTALFLVFLLFALIFTSKVESY